MDKKELNIFDKRNCPMSRRPYMSISKNSWQISLYKILCEILKIEAGDRVKFFQHKSRTKDWYIAKCDKDDTDGFLVKHYVGTKRNTDHFIIYNRILISAIFNSLALEDNIIKFRLGAIEKVTMEDKEISIFPIMVIKFLKTKH